MASDKQLYIIGVITTCCFVSIHGLTSGDLFSFGSSVDTVLPKKDDAVHEFTDIAVPFILYEKSYTNIQVSLYVHKVALYIYTSILFDIDW